MTDAELILHVLERDDEAAFATLVSRYQSRLRALLRRLVRGDEALADDLAQETLVRAYRHLATFRSQASFSTWLYRIAYRTFLRDSRSRRHLLEPLETSAAGESAHAPPAPSRGFRHDLELAMNQLSAPERAVLTLFLGSGLTHEEVAAALEIPIGTVKTHINRGRERLRALLLEWKTA